MITQEKFANFSVQKPVVKSSFNYDGLECKQLFAGITFDAGVIHIDGTSNADIATVDSLSETMIRVELSGFDAQTFELDDVVQIEFRGFAGDDEFSNNTDIAVRAFGNAGNDKLYGGTGHDFIAGGDGDDTLKGFRGRDEIYGGLGDDEIYGGTGFDSIFGSEGDDRLLGFGGNDIIFGGPGDDYLWAGAGNDVLRGGGGDDRLRGDLDDDMLFGQAGDDFLSGFSGDDILRGGEGDDLLQGGLGVDRLFGGIGDDRLEGGGFLYGGQGNDRISGGVNDDLIAGGEGADILDGHSGNDRIFGGPGNDSLFGGHGDDILAAAEGDDTISGYDGNDLVFGSSGNDVINGNLGNDRLLGGPGDDIINGGAGNDDISGGKDNDLIRGGKDDDILKGGDGDDRLHGLDGNDLLFGQKGIDSLAGGVGNDFARGGDGPDRVLVVDQDTLADLGPDDVEVVFRSVADNASWTNEEIFVLDHGFDHLKNATNNLTLFRNPISNQTLVYVKTDSPIQSRHITQTRIDPDTGETQFWIRDFDESDDRRNRFIEVEILRSVAIPWASNEVISAVLPDRPDFFSEFEAISSWTSEAPGNMDEFVLSGDGSQYYSDEAKFARLPFRQLGASLPPIDPLATLNSREDFASLWTFLYSTDRDDLRSEIQSKIDKIDELFSLLSIV